MTLKGKDWKKLRAPILILLAVIIASALLITASINFESQQEKLLKEQNTQHLIAKGKYLSSGSEKQEIITYLPQYQGLIEKGFIGEEHRHEWIQTLQSIQKSLKIFPIEYKLNPLETYKPSFFPNVGGFGVNKSTMEINFDMLHEGDILQLTETLAEKEYSNWLLRQCKVARLAKTKSNGANLSANCTIDWITLLEPTRNKANQ